MDFNIYGASPAVGVLASPEKQRGDLKTIP